MLQRRVPQHVRLIRHHGERTLLAETGRRVQLGLRRELCPGGRILRQDAALFNARVIVGAFEHQLQLRRFCRLGGFIDRQIDDIGAVDKAAVRGRVRLRSAADEEKDPASHDRGCRRAGCELCPERPAEALLFLDRLLYALNGRSCGQLLIQLRDALRAILRMQAHTVQDGRFL